MGQLIDIEEYRKVWLPVVCLCIGCGHRWQEVVHQDRVDHLECLRCGQPMGLAVLALGPVDYIVEP